MSAWPSLPRFNELSGINNGQQYEAQDGIVYTDFNKIVLNTAALRKEINNEKNNRQLEDDLITQRIDDTYSDLNTLRLRVTNVESQISPDLILSSKQFAYEVPVPARSTPYAKISMFGGMSYKSKNYIPYPYNLTSYDGYGMQIHIDTEQRLVVNGTPSEDMTFSLKDFSLPAGNYFFSAIQTSQNTRALLYKKSFQFKLFIFYLS